jgi:hypothetical protein
MPQRFQYPLSPSPDIAVYDTVEAFPAAPDEGVKAVAFPAGMLETALQWHWRPEFPVVVFTGPFAGVLTTAGREQIWRTWEVPVYEFRLDPAGAVIAEECDVHDGLHLRPESEPPSGLDWSRCPCGLGTPRIPTPRETAGVSLSFGAAA